MRVPGLRESQGPLVARKRGRGELEGRDSPRSLRSLHHWLDCAVALHMPVDSLLLVQVFSQPSRYATLADDSGGEEGKED